MSYEIVLQVTCDCCQDTDIVPIVRAFVSAV